MLLHSWDFPGESTGVGCHFHLPDPGIEPRSPHCKQMLYHLSHLGSPCLTTSNLPWFMDLTFQVPMQYCYLQHRTLLLSPVPSTSGYCFCFGSIPSVFLVWSQSPLTSSSILGTYQPGEFLFQYPIILPFHTVLGVLKARILKWFAIPFSSGAHSVRPLHHGPSVGLPHTAWLSFIELDKAVVLWSDWLVICGCGFNPPSDALSQCLLGQIHFFCIDTFKRMKLWAPLVAQW